jgi:hypothetical protein
MFRTLVLLALLAASVRADDKPKPNALTAKEIAEGWINLFDGETTFGWKVEGEAQVKDGELYVGGEKPTKLTSTSTLCGVALKLSYRTADGAAAKGGRISQGEVFKEFAKIVQEKNNMPWTSGRQVAAPIVIEVPAGQTIVFDRLPVQPSNGDRNTPPILTPLFNGKDLTGWKVNGADPKRTASKWSVTKDGELAVKDGPGDLVCEKEFANFVLQFECKTNGKALNSGIFFRCIPGQYQNGYEAQIQNAYKDDDRTKPADFGTGAIYRRIAARKVVSNDNEWFTMTVAANGKRISTWVNGYQTVDWTDDRKDDENPRKGYRAAKGPLSIQGHDPTTDILFRNIRAGELPTK